MGTLYVWISWETIYFWIHLDKLIFLLNLPLANLRKDHYTVHLTLIFINRNCASVFGTVAWSDTDDNLKIINI